MPGRCQPCAGPTRWRFRFGEQVLVSKWFRVVLTRYNPLSSWLPSGEVGMYRTLVLGGIRSGKTAQAEELASGTGCPVIYVATATAGDAEMEERIRRHRQLRPDGWGLVEETVDLPGVLGRYAGTGVCLLIDCMSLWLGNLLHHLDEDDVPAMLDSFNDQVADYPDPLIIVSNEVGLGIIGMDPLTRQFGDRLGWLNQDLAARMDHVVMSVAGCPLVLKGKPFAGPGG